MNKNTLILEISYKYKQKSVSMHCAVTRAGSSHFLNCKSWWCSNWYQFFGIFWLIFWHQLEHHRFCSLKENLRSSFKKLNSRVKH